jgi:hypothetical protein
MQGQPTAVIEPCQEVFAVAADLYQSSASKTRPKIPWGELAEDPRVAHDDLIDPLA